FSIMKRITAFLVFLMFMGTLGTNAIAAPYPPKLASPYLADSYSLTMSPRYSYTQTITATLAFDGGKAHCSGAVKPSGDYDCTIVVTLYKQNGTNWNYVTSWSGSATGGDKASAGGAVSVGSGTYKVVASGNVAGKEFPSKSVTRTKN
ncbi:MAG: hypothetical protein RSE38_18060, partial [Acinetobacter sp.]